MPRFDHAGQTLQEAFDHCRRIARDHYENFPVASFFLPKHLRPFIWAIYAFARTADDFADEGRDPGEVRLEKLNHWEALLDRCYNGSAEDPVFVALQHTVLTCGIPKNPLADLLTAFRMDVTQSRYDTFDELQGYCRYSANPIGRLVLYVFGDFTERNAELSDWICTALQLTNFWQDVNVDIGKGRSYIPLEDLSRFGYTESDLLARRYDERFMHLLRFEAGRAREMFYLGEPLLSEAAKELRFELRLTWRGGMRILDKLDQSRYNVFARRPSLSGWDAMIILTRALRKD